jgi:cell fate regulator YaaT (PSP1 superfamily)
MKIIQITDLLKNRLVRIDSPEEKLIVGDYVLLKTDRDRIVAQVTSAERDVPNIKTDSDYNFIKKLEEKDLKKFHQEMDKSMERVEMAKEIVDELKLPMRFFASYVDFDGKIASFFFVSEDQVDFREFLRHLSKKINKRVHLQRVGSRDKAKILGGVGPCGRPLCCSTWKTEIESVPLNSARDQNLITRFNDKLFGLCGKLKCCLMYELPHYREMRKHLPHMKQKVIAEGRAGRVVGLDILNKKVKVLFEEGGIAEVFSVDEIKIEGRTNNNQEQSSTSEKIKQDIERAAKAAKK